VEHWSLVSNAVSGPRQLEKSAVIRATEASPVSGSVLQNPSFEQHFTHFSGVIKIDLLCAAVLPEHRE
jgi:hypothetical protein